MNTFERPWKDVVRPVNDRERDLLRSAQLVLRIPQTGEMDELTIVRLRGIQGLFRLPSTGILDKATWSKLNEMRWIDAVHGEAAEDVQREGEGQPEDGQAGQGG